MTCQVIGSGGDSWVAIGGVPAPGRQPQLARPAGASQVAAWGLRWRLRHGGAAEPWNQARTSAGPRAS